MWDKFKDTRTANGSTQGGILAGGIGGPHVSAGGGSLHRARTTSSSGLMSASRQQRLVSGASVGDGTAGARAVAISRVASLCIPPAPPAYDGLVSAALASPGYLVPQSHAAASHMTAQGSMWYGGGGSFSAPYPYGHMYAGAGPHPGPGFVDPSGCPPPHHPGGGGGVQRQLSESARHMEPQPTEHLRSSYRSIMDHQGTPTRATPFQALAPQPRRYANTRCAWGVKWVIRCNGMSLWDP